MHEFLADPSLLYLAFIFTAAGTAIAGAFFGGSALAASFIGGALAFGTQLAVSYLTRPKKRSYGATPSTAVQGQREFGARVSAWAMFGTGKIAGHQVYYAKWGSGNKFNADVIRLAHGWCDGLEPYVYFYGAKHDLVTRSVISNEAAHYGVDGFGDDISIRFYDGRPGQGPDTKLVSDTASLGLSWKETSTGEGICYVVIERAWSAERFDKGEPQFEFVLRGLREYDPRKDSTVDGGSGSHRLNDPSTWEHTLNPAVHRFNYQLGLRGALSGRTLIGEGKSMGQLDLGSYIAAMNACDEVREGKATYECSLFVTADDDHTEILKEFDDAMAGYGMNRRGLSGVIAGAPQVPVFDIGPDDIDLQRPKQLKRRKSSFQLYNHISGQFTSPESHWNPESLDPVFINQDVADDGRPRQTANDFLQVTDPDIAQYLLQIRYRQNRKGGTATVPVSRRCGLAVQEGEWVTYAGLTWLITNWRMDESFRFTLTLAETGADVYASGGIVPGPIVVPPTAPVNPSLLSTVQNFNVEVGEVEGDGQQIPALRFTWTPPDDPTITAVRFEYFIGDTPPGIDIFRDSTGDAEAGEYITTKNIISGVLYTARATITTSPDRFKTFTAYQTTAQITPSFNLEVELSETQEALLQRIGEITGDLFEMKRDLDTLAGAVVTQGMSTQEHLGRLRMGVGARYGENKAAAEIAAIAASDANAALASIFQGVYAKTGAGEAESILKLSAISDQDLGAALAALDVALKAGLDGQEALAAFQLAALVDSELGLYTRFILKAQHAYLHTGSVIIPMHSLRNTAEVKSCPIVAGSPNTITPDLRERHLVHETILDDDARFEFPLGAWRGADWWHIVRQDGGDHSVSVNTFSYIDGNNIEPPDLEDGVISIYQGVVVQVTPLPIASLSLKRAGVTTAESTGAFAIEPAVNGKNVWILEIDGPLEITEPGTYTIVPIGEDLRAHFDLRACGGASGAIGNPTGVGITAGVVQQPTESEDTVLSGPGIPTVTAGAGKPSSSLTLTTNSSTAITTGGAKGEASGGDTNTDGIAGGNGQFFAGETQLVRSGVGAAAPTGGGAERPYVQLAINFQNTSTYQVTNGADGNEPGGGARGVATTNSTFSSRNATGGGGSGSRSQWTSTAGEMLQGLEYTLLVGAPGEAGYGCMSKNISGVPQRETFGGDAAPGKVVISPP